MTVSTVTAEKTRLFDTALSYKQANLDVIPDHPEMKYPYGIKGWQTKQFTAEDLQEYISEKGYGIGIRCNASSAEGLDSDNKGNPSADELFEEWKSCVESIYFDLVDSLVIEKTRSGGYHVIWRCEVIEGNQKLARRYPTEQELEKDPHIREVTLIETRGKGGQFMVAPSPGYTLIQGDFCNLPEITPEERNTLLNCARAFNKVIDQPKVQYSNNGHNEEAPWDIYDASPEGQREALQLLQQHGWKVTREINGAKYLKRPGTDKEVSASFGFVAPGVFYNFSANSQFDLNTSYSPSAIRAILKHNGDFKASGKELAKLYGSKQDTTDVLEFGKPKDVKFLPDSFIKNCFYSGEQGDAELFAKLFEDKVVFDHFDDKWYFWNGNHWEEDKTNQVITLIANQTAAQYLHLASVVKAKGEDDDEGKLSKSISSRAYSLKNVKKMNSVLTYAKSLLGITGEEWDRSNPWVLACKNGVVNLKTGELEPGNPRDYIRISSPYEWKGLDEPAPTWEKTIREMMANDEEMIGYIRRVSGYSITGTTKEDKFFIFYGEQGRNGKRTYTETIASVLGKFASPVSKEVMIVKGQSSEGAASPHLYALRGLRFAWISETGASSRINSEQAKYMSGSDIVRCRPLRREEISFPPTHKLFLLTNRKPKCDFDDDALFERVQFIELTQSFVDNPIEPHQHKIDRDLPEKLLDEGSGILAWLVRGCLEWQRDGLKTPKKILDDTDTYRNEQNSMAPFIEEMLVEEELASIGAGELFSLYTNWCDTSKQKFTLDKNKFGKAMKKLYRSNDQESAKRVSKVIYYGIRKREDNDDAEEQAGEQLELLEFNKPDDEGEF